MKKNLFLLATAVLALTGCVKSQVVEVADSKEIGFDSYVGKHTRATVINGRSELSRFYVYGNIKDDTATENLFNGMEVYWSGTNSQDGHYEYNDGVSKQWESNKTYYFAAVSNGNAVYDSSDEDYVPVDVVNLSYEFDGTGVNQLTITDYTVTDKDLIVDIADPISTGASMTGRETVTFDFKHLLTRVRFIINNGDAVSSNSVIAVEDLKFSGVKMGDCTYKLNPPASEWNLETPGVYQYTPAAVVPGTTEGNAYVITPSSNKSFGHFVIPQSNEDKKVSFTLVTYTKEIDGVNTTYVESNRKYYEFPLKFDNTESMASLDPDYTWQAGKVYQYSITLAGTINYIRFDANVSSWNFDLNGDGHANTSDDISLANPSATNE